MIDLSAFAHRPVAVLGLGRSGLATARALAAAGAEVWAWDDNNGARAEARRGDVPLVDLTGCDWHRAAALVLSPGIPLTHPTPHPVVGLARSAGCEVVGDIELLARARREAAFIGITGTNGKSTTTALVGHVLESAGRRVQVGGNIGIPALDCEPLGAGGVYVLEMSSFQLDLSPSVVFDVAVLLNISPDHLERHGGMEGYVKAKMGIFRGRTPDCTAVVGVDDERSRAIFESLRAEGGGTVIPVSGRGRAAGGVYARRGVLHDETRGYALPMMDLKTVPALPGEHNWQNAAAAYATARAAGVDHDDVVAGIASYPGLAHRQERVAVIGGVAFVNDSKATNADAAARALASYDAVYWIAGGRPKEGGIEAVMPYLDRVRHAFLIGEAAQVFAAALGNRVPVTVSGTLEAAVEAAAARARDEAVPGAVVLLSPACASFDQFTDFEARGDAFRRLVEGLS